MGLTCPRTRWSTSGTTWSRTSPERRRSACGPSGSIRDFGTARTRTERMPKSGATPNCRDSWRNGDEGNGRGASDSRADQVPWPRGPDPPPPIPRFDQRVHRAPDDTYDRRVRRLPARSGDDRRQGRHGAGHGEDPLRRRCDPREGLSPNALPDGFGERLPVEHRPRRECIGVRGPRHGLREGGRTPPEPGGDFPVRPTRRRFRGPVRDRRIQQVEDGPHRRGLLCHAAGGGGPTDRDGGRGRPCLQADGGRAPGGPHLSLLPRTPRGDAATDRGDGVGDPKSGCGGHLRPRGTGHAHAPRDHDDRDRRDGPLATRHAPGDPRRTPSPGTGGTRLLLDRHRGHGLREHVPGSRGRCPPGDRRIGDRNDALHGRWTRPTDRRTPLLSPSWPDRHKERRVRPTGPATTIELPLAVKYFIATSRTRSWGSSRTMSAYRSTKFIPRP